MTCCPLCGSREIGRIGRQRYYCSECCHEWTGKFNQIKIYSIFPDGTVASLKEVKILPATPRVHRQAG